MQSNSNNFDKFNTLDQIVQSVTDNGLGSSIPLFNNFHKNSGNDRHNGPEVTVTIDQVTLLLEGKTLKPNDYIELHDSTSYKIVTGHLVVKVPCTEQNQSKVEFLTGEAPNFKVTNAEFIPELSTPGQLCLYR